MTKPSQKRGFASRPADPESWIRTPAEPAAVQVKGDAFTARLTIDVTPELRGRIKITAFGRGVTVADLLRDLLAGDRKSVVLGKRVAVRVDLGGRRNIKK